MTSSAANRSPPMPRRCARPLSIARSRTGTEVLVRIDRCGVCHSDLHMQDGYFALGDDKKLDVRAGRTLPFTLGHEIAGVIERAGPEPGIARRRAVAVYPWIGCGACAACRARRGEHLCCAAVTSAFQVDGGYAPTCSCLIRAICSTMRRCRPRLPAPLMCSGLTAYAALKRARESHASHGPVLLVGIGGVGMMGLAIARRCSRSRRSSPTSIQRSGTRRSRPARTRPSIRPMPRRAQGGAGGDRRRSVRRL